MGKASTLRNLGPTGLKITPIGLGCWQFSRGQGLGGKYWTYLDQSQVDEIVRLSLECGLNWFDTAESYGAGESERALSRALRAAGRRPGEVVIATKWMPLFRRASSILKTIDVRLKNLDGFPIDLYQVHNPYSFSRVEREMKAMAELMKEKKIASVGVSNFSAKRMRRASSELKKHGLSLASNQVRYSLLDRRIEANGVLDAARDLGTTIIAYSPLAQGILSGKFHDDPELIKKRSGYRKYMRAFKKGGLEKSLPVVQVVRELAVHHGVTPSQVALSWVVNNQGPLVVAIPGATSAEQARDNAGAMDVRLSREDLERLSAVSAGFKK
jgi:aryl-alcohol dehydrogenase-like predicted oxidoreductase